MSEYSCQVLHLRTEALSGFRHERDALSAGGHYLCPDADGRIDASGRTGLCVVCENCGSVVENASDADLLECPDCGESTFRVLQTFRLLEIKGDFSVRWHVPNLWVKISVPAAARRGMLGVRYTVDGSEPTLASPAYSAPIPFHKEYKPLRAAVFYPDARSQIVEWDYGRAERNRDRIRKQSDDQGSRDEPGSRPKPRSAPTAPPPRRAPPSPPPIRIKPPGAEPTKPKDENKGCGCLMALAMGIGGVVLIGNDAPGIGVILAIAAFFMAIGLLKD